MPERSLLAVVIPRSSSLPGHLELAQLLQAVFVFFRTAGCFTEFGVSVHTGSDVNRYTAQAGVTAAGKLCEDGLLSPISRGSLPRHQMGDTGDKILHALKPMISISG